MSTCLPVCLAFVALTRVKTKIPPLTYLFLLHFRSCPMHFQGFPTPFREGPCGFLCLLGPIREREGRSGWLWDLVSELRRNVGHVRRPRKTRPYFIGDRREWQIDLACPLAVQARNCGSKSTFKPSLPNQLLLFFLLTWQNKRS